MRNIILYLLLAITPCLYGLNKVDEVQLVSGKNYITNGGAEQGKAGWVRYADAAATSPVDGTAGSPNASTTITSTSSSPLAGAYSLLLTKDASNRQGEGVSYAFSIESGNQAKMLSLSFLYNSSANFAVSSGASGSESDVEVWIYDVTNSVLIPIAPYKLTAQPLQNGLFQGTFQTASNSTSYRLIFHIATTNASAWTLKFDNVSVSRQPILFGAPITDPVTFTSTITGLGAGGATQNMMTWQRMGNLLHLVARLDFTGAPSGATAIGIQIPSGLSIDYSNRVSGTSQFSGASYLSTSGTTLNAVAAHSANGSNIITFAKLNTANTPDLTGGDIANPALYVDIFVPITGWASSVQMSQDTDTRVVTARMNYNGASYNLGNSTQATVKFDTVDFDTHGALTTGASPVFTVPVPGYYKVDADYEFATNGTGQRALSLYKNGAQVSEINQTGNPSGTNGNRLHGTDTVKCVAGDTLAIFAFQSSGGTLTIGGSGTPYNYATFTRVSGPVTIASTETVAARGNTSVTNSASGIVVYTAKTYDTHGAFDTSTGRYTCPTPGKYSVKAAVTYSSTAFSAGAAESISLYKNAVQFSQLAYHQVEALKTEPVTLSGSDEIQCLAGDILDIRTSGSAVALDGSAINNFVAISRIGSY